MLKSELKSAGCNILLMMSGSIACSKASTLIPEWVARGYRVRVVCTRSVAEFISHSDLQALGAELVFDNVFTPDQDMEHISLGKWADIVVVAPATSNLINKLSAGIADDAVSTVWQAAYGLSIPMLITPAMNTRMWRYPATQESVLRLGQWGIRVLPVAEGELACGEQGEGRMLEVAEILDVTDHLLNRSRGRNGKRILITAGGTREPIDSVRFIGNMSSGRTAAQLADELTASGHEISWLGAGDAMRPKMAQSTATFYSFADLASRLKSMLESGQFDVVIHAAAVSDFSVASVEDDSGDKLQKKHGKLSSDSDLLLRLKRNPKLLGQLKTWSGKPGLQVIGFKLTDTNNQQQRLVAVKKQLDHPGVDAVVHNDLSEIGVDSHQFRVYTTMREGVHCEDGKALAMTIKQLMTIN